MRLQVPPMVEPIMARVIPMAMQMKVWMSKKALDRDPKFREGRLTVLQLRRGMLMKPAGMQPFVHGADHASKAEAAQLDTTVGNLLKTRYRLLPGIMVS